MWCATIGAGARRRAQEGRLVAAQEGEEEEWRAPPWTTSSARVGSTAAATHAPAAPPPKPGAPARPSAGAALAAHALHARPDHSTDLCFVFQ